MIAPGDIVRVHGGKRILVVTATGAHLVTPQGSFEGLIAVADFFTGEQLRPLAHDGSLELLCSKCHREASRFDSKGAALCQEHAQYTLTTEVRTLGARCPCTCGEDLEAGKSLGIWTIGNVACEYRECAHCARARAYMPADVIEGAPCEINSELGERPSALRWNGLLDALDYNPIDEQMVIRRGAAVLATALVAVNGEVVGWKIATPLRERPASK